MSEITVALGPMVFEFPTFPTWINKSRDWFLQRGLCGEDVVCVDARGRVCRNGKHFDRALEDGAFPVKCYLIESEGE